MWGKGNIGRTTVLICCISAILGYVALGSGDIPLLPSSLNGLITETSAYSDAYPSSLELAEMNSFSGYSTGYGGQQRPTPLLASITQGSSIISSAPMDTDYLVSIEKEGSGTTDYTVTEGDSLSRIAFDFGVDADAILRINPEITDPHSLSLGMVLEIPPVEGIIHIVEQGDTIESLSQGYQTDADSIAFFNDLSKEASLIVGSRVIVPGGTIPEAPQDDEGSSHRNFSYLPSSDDYFQKPTTGLLTQNIHGRNAVDIANQCGTPIYSAAGGVVSTANSGAWNGGYGQYVVIGHSNGTETLYAHAQELFVGEGDLVSKGQLIGEIGSSGLVFGITGCHLHFEVHGAQNPLARY